MCRSRELTEDASFSFSLCSWKPFVMCCFVCRRHDNTPPCTGSRVNTNYDQCQWRTGDHRILEIPLVAHFCSQRPNHSAMTHPLKRIDTSRAISHIGYNSESILGRNVTPLSCLHLELAHRYYLLWRRHGNMPPCTGSRVTVNTNYERIASWGGCQWRTRALES